MVILPRCIVEPAVIVEPVTKAEANVAVPLAAIVKASCELVCNLRFADELFETIVKLLPSKLISALPDEAVGKFIFPLFPDEIVEPFKVILSTVRAVKVPRLVIFVCAAPVTVAAVPDTLPVTLPTNAVEVMLVAPVTTPASTLIVPSRTIAEPLAGVRFKAPEFAVIVLPFMPRLSTVSADKVPKLVTFVWAAVDKVPSSTPVGLATSARYLAIDLAI